ncbi:MAG: T9SS type A sorting domain-containing protein [Bacteroidales bacterium]|nr:T9SS type A sorting domain-containing protein [Bacteroidales bacterium]
MNIRTGLRNATLQVYDMQGRIVYQQIITDEVTSIDTSKWKSGTYIWELGTENGSRILESGKWVKD